MSILIVFGSHLGRTKRLAVLLGTELQKAGFQVKVKDVRDTAVEEVNNHDLNLFACSTWDDGMLQHDFRPFHQKLMRSKFPGRKYAVIGLGGHKYPHYCTAPDIIASAAKISGGTVIIENLKLDLDHDEPMDKCDQQLLEWKDKLVQILKN